MTQHEFIRFLMNVPEEKMKEHLTQAFLTRYGTADEQIIMIASPARINIIGEHIDYNGGKVFPAAINRFLYVLIRKRRDSTILYDDIRFPGIMQFKLNNPFMYDKKNGYTNYLNGMVSILEKNEYPIETGFEVLIFSKLPAGGGISSSSALEIGFGLALAEAFSFKTSPITLAKMGQESEHTFMNVQCGIMDQFSIAMGKKDHAILLDTATLEYEYVPLVLGEYRIVVMNSNKQRTLADSKYNERLNECMSALALLRKKREIKNICTLTSTDIDFVQQTIDNELLVKRVRHCITENERVEQSVKALQENDLQKLGMLLKESHMSLQNDYEVTGMELDCLTEAANSYEHCLGSRMTGAGFGGCAIALVHKEAVEAFTAYVTIRYKAKTGLMPAFFACTAGDGSRRI